MKRLDFRYPVFILITVVFVNFRSYSQVERKSNFGNFGFHFSGMSNKFKSNNYRLSQDYNTGFGLGVFYIKKLNNSFNVTLAAQILKQYHKFDHKSSDIKIKELGLSVPLDLHYNLFKTSIFLTAGVEYYNANRYESNVEQSLKRGSMNLPIGIIYDLKFRYFTLSPQIKYRQNIENSLGSIHSQNGEQINLNRRSGFEICIKVR